jgi:enamidase
MTSLAITNIGTLVSGDLEQGIIPGNTIVIENGLIAAIGDDVPTDDATSILDAQGTTVAPGLIDSHVHIVIGDYTPRQKTVDFLESYMHGGITTSISASEVHAPGRPSDPVGVKALAIAAQRCFRSYRPGGMRVWGGSVIVEPGLTAADFAELAAAGVGLAKAGFGSFEHPAEAAPMARWAQEQGMVVMLHTGGASIPGSSPVTAEDVLAIAPDVIGHVNGGTTALPDSGAERVVRESQGALQICQAGNLRSALLILRLAQEHGQLARVLIASDTPTGTGTMPLAMIKSVVELSSLGTIPAEQALALATGNVARAYRLSQGVLSVGRPADLFICDAPLGGVHTDALSAIEYGDLPGISAVVIGGEICAFKSRNTPPAIRMAIRVR